MKHWLHHIYKTDVHKKVSSPHTLSKKPAMKSNVSVTHFYMSSFHTNLNFGTRHDIHNDVFALKCSYQGNTKQIVSLNNNETWP